MGWDSTVLRSHLGQSWANQQKMEKTEILEIKNSEWIAIGSGVILTLGCLSRKGSLWGL